MKSYYNTNNLSGSALAIATEDAVSQENLIQSFFNKHPTGEYTASDVEYELKKSGKLHDRTPITSIRRAITTLMKDGRLAKLDKTIISPHGMGSPEHLYQLAPSWKKAVADGVQQDLFNHE
ncbi:hypothetical protein [Chitinophaga sp. sic0106]|uniref:hypothetical protein n=1 Tax=Chitinophaga sp. sic0106 TaxID=2854785 RepID=UPI001C48720E|nr:hypothetical protein [Chitinophaga sp. sic0106]MBV7531315.1 hypothetical protein [Chitinophaga sp. sic0106]